MITHQIESRRLPDNLLSQVEAACKAHGLQIALTTTLKSYPGSKHWHLRRRRPPKSGAEGPRPANEWLPGLIEVTHWPERGRLWVSVHESRDGGWARAACPAFARTLAAKVNGKARKPGARS
jgi:hypothetical protein